MILRNSATCRCISRRDFNSSLLLFSFSSRWCFFSREKRRHRFRITRRRHRRRDGKFVMMKSARRRFKRHHLSFYFSTAKKKDSRRFSPLLLFLSLFSLTLSSERRAKTLALFYVKNADKVLHFFSLHETMLTS